MSQERDEQDIFLGMPGYDHLTGGAARGFYRAVTRPNRVNFAYNEGSLLAANFNNLWCRALNLTAEGRGPRYFAMIHSDIEPEDFWLDKLIEELEAKDLDILGVAAPIKDRIGLTSTAVAREDGDTWRVKCRITMTELYDLPETFTSDDIPGKLPVLLNTGLWVCRFNLEWAKKVHFEINDRIVYSTKDGRYHQETEPEDWNFSRQCHAMGLKIGCTRKVKLLHRGGMRWGNDRPFGEPFDAGYVEQSIFQGDDWFPHKAAGWLTVEEGQALRDLARDKVALEIGSYCGRSTICLAQDARQVYAVDTFDGRGTPTEGETRGTFVRNLAKYGVDGIVKTLVGESTEIVPELPAVFDLVFIDGSHDFDSVAKDIEISRGVLKPDGLLAFHDYGNESDPGVAMAVDELLGEGGELVSRHGSIAVVRPPARKLQEV